MNADSKLARSRLESAAHSKDRIRCRRWLVIIGFVALLALVSVAALDYWLLLPLELRYGTTALLALVAVLGAWGWRRLSRNPTSVKEAALDAETQRNEHDCVVSTAAEYAAGKVHSAHAYEPELAAALQIVAADRLAAVQLPYGRTLLGPLALLGLAVAALVAFLALAPGAWTALKRVSLPWLRAQYTMVDVKPRNVEVRLGHSVEVSGLFSGRPPKDPRLQWQVDGDPVWRAASMMKSGARAFVYPLTNVTVPVKYRVSGGDALSPEFSVMPYIPPEWKDLRIGLVYPEYAKLKAVVQSTPDVTILRGSTATLHLRANVDLSMARLRFTNTNLAPVDLRQGEDGLWTGSLKIVTNSEYQIELFDRKGRRGEDETPYHIVATSDASPSVEILEPGQDMRAGATNRIAIRVSVADDYGVAGIKVVYHKLNGAAQSVACQTESTKNGEWIAIAEIDLATLGLTRYDVVAYHAEAMDNNTLDGPGIGRSPLYFVEITDKQSGPTPLVQPMPGEQINLLVVQKQIIADTAALNSSSPATNYLELALRQTNAVGLGRMYLQTMAGVPAEAVTEMNSAIASMEKAIPPLNKFDNAAAIPPEEEALAHLYRVLALLPDLKMLAIATNLPPVAPAQKPPMTVELREIRKPAPESTQVDPEIEQALEEARELSRAQAELNALGQKLTNAQTRSESAALDPQARQAIAPQAKFEGHADGQGQGQGEGQGQANGAGIGEKPPDRPDAKTPLENNTNRVIPKPTSLAQTNKVGSTNDASKPSTEPTTQAQTQPGKNSTRTNAPTPATLFAQGQMPKGTGEGNKPGKGQGKGKGKAKATGQKGKGKGQGTKPAGGAGQPSTQQQGGPPEMAADHPEDAPDSPEELAEKQEDLSAEAKALGEMLQRLAGKGTRVGHNLARSANQAAEHMEGAALALKQGNASGAGMRGTLSSAELDQLVTELERIVGKRPDLTDVAGEEAPKEYEAFISEYFRKLSYEK